MKTPKTPTGLLYGDKICIINTKTPNNLKTMVFTYTRISSLNGDSNKLQTSICIICSVTNVYVIVVENLYIVFF